MVKSLFLLLLFPNHESACISFATSSTRKLTGSWQHLKTLYRCPWLTHVSLLSRLPGETKKKHLKMSAHGKSLLFLLRRCVAVGQLTPSTGLATRGGVLTSRGGFIQQRTWTSTTRTTCLQRLCQLQSAVKSSQYSFCTKVRHLIS